MSTPRDVLTPESLAILQVIASTGSFGGSPENTAAERFVSQSFMARRQPIIRFSDADDIVATWEDLLARHDVARGERATVARPGDGPALGDGTFIRPVPGPITSGFGYRTDPVTGGTGYHAGLDIGAPCGTPIKAAGTGVILSAGFNSGGYGNMTLINHGNGLSTLYGHQSSIIVSAGQTVTQGQEIGRAHV